MPEGPPAQPLAVAQSAHGALRRERRGAKVPASGRRGLGAQPHLNEVAHGALGGSGAGQWGPRKRTPGVRGEAPSE